MAPHSKIYNMLYNHFYLKISRFPEIQKQIKQAVLFPGTSQNFAQSITLGIFIGMIIPMGFQTMVTLPLAVLFRVNIVISTLATLITNPVTALPLYYVSFKIGEFITGIQLTQEQITNVINQPNFDSIMSIGYRGAIVYLTGSLIHGIVWASFFYFLSFKIHRQLLRLKAYHHSKSQI